jgi:hypothetical protein
MITWVPEIMGFIRSVYRACARSGDAAAERRGAGKDDQYAKAEHDALGSVQPDEAGTFRRFLR